MANAAQIVTHYGQSGLVESIRAGLDQLGVDPSAATIADLAPVDEFHVGGRPATVALCESLGLDGSQRVLDVGCGIGGLARFIAVERGASVVGIDLTPEYIEAAQALTAWVGATEKVDYVVAAADSLPHDGPFREPFDAATMLHVGMNIADKTAAFAAVGRALRPGALFGIYDNVSVGPGSLQFPVPWASEPAASHVVDAEAYSAALKGAGFVVEAINDRGGEARDFFARLRARSVDAGSSGGPPPLGLHLLMGPDAGTKTANLFAAINDGVVAPTEIIARKL